ncbi:hypothetical protein [Ramlibacter sp.]|uniref:hypothetical protein n=1 Tax=Ramlibacter sp. TaxID=1917967 RepID=UPI002BFEC7D5|nr:hypothetical protein [Ramlibacter sp.]HWI81903.1 hypothetical protein [Ramlibacter sp.]
MAFAPPVLLLAALRAAPRRYRLPALPGDAEVAAALGAETALAFAMEAARAARQHHSPPPDGARALFTASLAGLIRRALAADGGDPGFQALLLQAQDGPVREHVQLSAQRAADRRAVRSAIDALAHPGKLRGAPAGPPREALGQLHRLASAGSWPQLGSAVERLLRQQSAGDETMRAGLAAIAAMPALQRLVRGGALLGDQAVQRYVALRERHGPAAGSAAAAARGRAAARLGALAEDETVQALREIAALLDRHDRLEGRHRIARSLRPPRGFPGQAGKAKDEWDAAIVRTTATGAADVVLLAEVKAAPAAATPDFSRLHRGLQRLAHASAGQAYDFASADGPLRVSGESLRGLQPPGRCLPAHVIYCCTAPPEAQPQMLSAASKAALLAESACLAFARQLAAGASPPASELAPVWEALAAPRLRSALHQYETAQAAREAMLHPHDLLAAVARQLQAGPHP